MSRRSAIALALLVLVIPWGLEAQLAPAPATLESETVEASRPLAFTDLAPRPDKRRGAMQLWSYHFFLQDGLEISLQLSEANLKPVFGEVAGVELSVLGFDERNRRLIRGFDAAELTFSTQPPELRIQPDIWVQGELSGAHRVRCAVSKNDVAYDLDLELHDIVSGPAGDDNHYELAGGQEITLEIPIAFSSVSGTIVIDGEGRQVEGVAVMEHIFLSTWAARLLSQAYYVFELGERWRVGYYMETSRRHGNRILGYGLEARPADDSDRLPAKPDLLLPRAIEMVDSARVKGVDVPQRVEIDIDPDRLLTLRLGAPRQAFSLLQEVGGALRWLAELYIGGDPWVFRGTGELEEAGAPENTGEPVGGGDLRDSRRLHYAMMIID